MAFFLLLTEKDRTAIGSEQLKLLQAAYDAAYPDLEVSAEVELTTLKGIQSLNRQYRDLDEPTDVLSFPTLPNLAEIRQHSKESVLIGSIVISPEKAVAYGERLIDLVHHGLLHLLGFDHEQDQVQWNKEEEAVLSAADRLGLALKGIPHD